MHPQHTKDEMELPEQHLAFCLLLLMALPSFWMNEVAMPRLGFVLVVQRQDPHI